MRGLNLIASFVIATTVLSSCMKEDVQVTPNFQDEFIGFWDVLETTGKYKPQNYTVEITAGDNIDELIIIGLNKRPDIKVRAVLNAYDLSIPSQYPDSIFFSGSGTATFSFDQINMSFVVDDGWGADSIEAVLIP